MAREKRLIISLDRIREARRSPRATGPCDWALVENSPRYVAGVGLVYEGATETEFPDALLTELAREPDRLFYLVRSGLIPVSLERARAAYRTARSEGRIKRALGEAPASSSDGPQGATPTGPPDRFTPRR